MINLYPHQQKIVDSGRTKLLLAHSTGTGKTVTSISLCNKHLSKNQSVLVIVPKIIKEKWQRDMANFSITNYVVITKEEFKRDVKTMPRHDAVIVDEGHYFAGIKSQMSKSLYWYLNHYKIEYRFIATATPYLSTPLNIYVLARHLGHEWNYRTFVKRFFYEVPMGHRVVLKVRSGIESAIADLVRQIGDVVDMEEVIDIPEQDIKTVFVDKNEEQIEAIQAIYEPQFIVEWTKKHQIENGFVYELSSSLEFSSSELDNSYMKQYPSEKVDFIINFAKTKDKFAIFCRYKAQIEILYNVLTEAGYNVLRLSGDTQNRDQVINEMQNTDKCIAIIQSSCSVGYELTSINDIIFASLSFSYVDYQQALGRFLRINNPTPNNYIHLVVRGGVDEDVYNCIMKKQDFSLEIYGKNKSS